MLSLKDQMLISPQGDVNKGSHPENSYYPDHPDHSDNSDHPDHPDYPDLINHLDHSDRVRKIWLQRGTDSYKSGITSLEK